MMRSSSDTRLAQRVQRANLETWRLRRIVDALMRLRESDDTAQAARGDSAQFMHEEQKLQAEITRRDKLYPPRKPDMHLKSPSRFVFSKR